MTRVLKRDGIGNDHETALPVGWSRSVLGEIGEYLNGRAFKASEWRKHGRPIIRIQDLTGTGANPNYFDGMVDDRHVVRPGDLLISWSATLDAYLWSGPDGVLNQHIFKVRSHIDQRFHYRLVKHILRDLYADTHGSGIVHITKGKFEESEIMLPPLAEQKRIVAKVEELLARVNAARERLAKTGPILKRFRQSVLAAACSGQLTADWREERDISEPADRMLNRLLALRITRWPEFTRTRYKPPVHPDGDWSEEVHETWTLASMDQLTVTITSGSRDWSRFYGRGSGTFIMAQNVRRGYLDRSFRQAVDPPSTDRDRARSQVLKGDLLVTIVGANTGDVCPVREELPEHYVCQSVSLMRPVDPALCLYLNLWLNSSAHGRGQYERYIYGEGRPHLSFDHLRMTPVALPSLAEQREIVRRVEALFVLAEKVEARIKSAIARVENITQAILAKAFRGELVPTEAELAHQQGRDYEPASVLLERIRASRNGEHEKPARSRTVRPDVAAPAPTLFGEEPPPITRTKRRPRKMRIAHGRRK